MLPQYHMLAPKTSDPVTFHPEHKKVKTKNNFSKRILICHIKWNIKHFILALSLMVQ